VSLRLLAALGALCALSCVSSATAATDAEPPSLLGRSVAELLREAASDGIRVIFTDQLVPSSMRVSVEPQSRSPIARLDEVLGAHALMLEEISTDVYAVKRVKQIDAAPAPAAERLAQVEVTASRYEVDASSFSGPLALVGTDMQRQPALFDDATRSIRQFPGTAGQDLSSRTSVRGGLPEDNLLVLDGVPLYEPWALQTLPVNFSLIDEVLVSGMEFYSGVLPVERGNRMGGLIDMHVRDPAEALGGQVALSNFDVSGLVSDVLPAESGDWMIFGKRGLLSTASYPDEWDVGHPKVSSTFGRVRYRLDDRTSLTVGTLAAHDRVQLDAHGGDIQFNDDSNRGYAWASYEAQRGDWRSRTTLSFTRNEITRVDQMTDLYPVRGNLYDRRVFQMTLLQHSSTLPLRDGSVLRWGAALREDRARFTYSRSLSLPASVAGPLGRPTHEMLSLHTQPTLNEQELYGGWNQSIGRRLTLDIGAHGAAAQYSTHQSGFILDPRVSLRLDLSAATRARISAGRMTQIWGAWELPVEQGRQTFDVPSASDQYVMALEHDFGARFSVRVEAFHKHVSHPRPRIENTFSPNTFLPELRADAAVISPESSRTRGVDLYATAAFTEHVQGWLSYSRSRAVDVIDSTPVPRAWDQPNALGLGLAAEGGAWLLSANLFVRSGWPVTPLEGPRNSARSSTFLSLDVKAAYRKPFSSGTLRFEVDATNATDRTNFCCGELRFARSAPGGGTTVYVGDRNWLPITPYATITWLFGETRAARSTE